MRDFNAERLEIQRDHEKAMADVNREEELLSRLPSGYDWTIYWNRLYGVIGDADVKHNFFQRDAKPIGLADVAAIADALPPEPMVMVRDSCLSFRPLAPVLAMPEKDKERWQEEVEIAPFTVRLNAFQQHTAEFEWYTMTPAGLVGIGITLPTPPALGRIEVDYKKYMGGTRIDSCRFHPADKLHSIMRGDEAIAQLESPVKWASGGPEYPSKFTLYFMTLGDAIPTAADLVRTITED